MPNLMTQYNTSIPYSISLVYIDDTDGSGLELFKVYSTIVFNMHSRIIVLDDNGSQYILDRKHFITIDEFRAQKIDKIL